jgi:fatty-acid desaturase
MTENMLPRLINERANAVSGRVVWSSRKSLWITSMYLGTVVGAVWHFSWDAFLVFVLASGITLCAGHSVGMHRRLIHRSFDCPKWLEQLIVYLGTLVGLGGPLTMTFAHDLRDWAQRQKECNDYFSHRRPIFVDAWWQMHCEIALDSAPKFHPEPEISENRFYRFLDRTDMLQQLPWAVLFLAAGGVGWAVWGVCARIAVSVTGHWLVGYFAHNHGERRWHVDGAGVQGFNVPFTSIITFGECWHNNHHAYPRSARIGLYEGQIDPGWLLIKIFELLGWARNIQTPETLPPRPELVPVDASLGNIDGDGPAGVAIEEVRVA